MAHKPGICSMSLGRCFAGHSLEHKLDMARKHDFAGIELFYEDLLHLAKSFPGGPTPENQVKAARAIKQLCDARNLAIICLQPFMHFGGLLDREEHQRQLHELQLWFELVHVLRTDLIVFPSSFRHSDRITRDMSLISRDFAEAADMGLAQTPVVRFAFEALCWGTRVDTWEASWDVVQRVNRPNFGVCLDTYNILGRIYADPTSPTGRSLDCEGATASSIQSLVHHVDVQKVFLVQVADGERLATPLDKAHPFYDPQQLPRMSWSRNARLFYGEPQYGGYMPVEHVLAALTQRLGYEGWLSFEVFNRRLANTDRSIPEEMAKRAAASWAKMKKDLGLRTDEVAEPRMQAML